MDQLAGHCEAACSTLSLVPAALSCEDNATLFEENICDRESLEEGRLEAILRDTGEMTTLYRFYLVSLQFELFPLTVLNHHKFD